MAKTSAPFWLGLKDAAPFMLVVVPFALLFGVVATEAGLDLLAVMGFSVVVIAGAAQFTAVALLADHAPIWIAVLTALAVNLRMAMYSAALTPYLGKAPFWQRALVAYSIIDQTYTVGVARFEEHTDWSLSQRLSYWMGAVAVIMPLWFVFTAVGAAGGAQIPKTWALDFAVPITFIAMFAPLLRSVPHLVAALTSAVLALLLMGLPAGVGLLIAALVAMIVGAQTERWMESRHD